MKEKITLEEYETSFGSLPEALKPRASLGELLEDEESDESPVNSGAESNKPDDSEFFEEKEETKNPTASISRLQDDVDIENLNFFGTGR